ncbi:helix-turn-helix domain-containing protein [Streptomyces sp. TRM68367]|uniref:helix-turn-helix domain-containing protein n=1 Tax=Streptomyces sp. TRM68367 TaxID=2758415 RepID=UPI00165B2A9F|nr:helix-turn-helix transcriptional regulator [Streptomyces sp. TRM68367]MBC9727925.1 helix-turn-helix transcriptional regulator [Streptomyces sp. TRM68367]
MSEQAPNEARVIPLRRPAAGLESARPAAAPGPARPAAPPARPEPAGKPREPLWRDLVGDVLRRERLAQERTLKDVADEARISMPYLSEVERGRKEASSEVLAAAAHALGLSLGDLLTRAHGELTRVTSRYTNRSRGASTSSYDGLCMVA